MAALLECSVKIKQAKGSKRVTVQQARVHLRGGVSRWHYNVASPISWQLMEEQSWNKGFSASQMVASNGSVISHMMLALVGAASGNKRIPADLLAAPQHVPHVVLSMMWNPPSPIST